MSCSNEMSSVCWRNGSSLSSWTYEETSLSDRLYSAVSVYSTSAGSLPRARRNKHCSTGHRLPLAACLHSHCKTYKALRCLWQIFWALQVGLPILFAIYLSLRCVHTTTACSRAPTCASALSVDVFTSASLSNIIYCSPVPKRLSTELILQRGAGWGSPRRIVIWIFKVTERAVFTPLASQARAG